MAKAPSTNMRTVLFLGGPDTGKSNYLARLWASLTEDDSALSVPVLPNQMRYLEQSKRHLAEGKFVPRSAGEELGELNATIHIRKGRLEGSTAQIQMPDVMGELWKDAANDREIDPSWIAKLKQAVGALLFVRPMSDENVDFLDWVTAAHFMEAEQGSSQADAEFELPSQVVASEMMTLLEDNLGRNHPSINPRVAIVAASWDIVPPEVRKADPLTFLEAEFPMFAGRLRDCDRLDVRVFGCSVVGGDLKDDEEFRKSYRDIELEKSGFVCVAKSDGTIEEYPDLTLPLAWVLGSSIDDAN